jgi:hypothetical protein
MMLQHYYTQVQHTAMAEQQWCPLLVQFLHQRLYLYGIKHHVRHSDFSLMQFWTLQLSWEKTQWMQAFYVIRYCAWRDNTRKTLYNDCNVFSSSNHCIYSNTRWPNMSQPDFSIKNRCTQKGLSVLKTFNNCYCTLLAIWKQHFQTICFFYFCLVCA